MGEYKNIKYVETLDDGTMNVLLRNGKKVLIEISKFNEKFEAAIYRLILGDPPGMDRKPLHLLDKLQKHDAYKDCAKEALGWVDENSEEFIKAEELGEVEYDS